MTQRATAVSWPQGRKLHIQSEPLAPNVYLVKWGKEGNIALVDTDEEIIEIDPRIPPEVIFAVQLFIAQELRLDEEDLRNYEVEFKRVR